MEYANYIAHCIEIARKGAYFVAPNPMVGAVLVGKPNPDNVLRTATGSPIEQSSSPVEGREVILAEGWHERYGEGHAEVNCFKSLEKSNYRDIDISKCTLFVSLEPCSHYGKTPPCAKLIIEKGVGRVVVGMLDPNPLVAGKGVQMLRDAGIEVVVGVMEKECRELNKRFLCLHEKKRPYVVLKWAQTADGFIDGNRQNSEFKIKNSKLHLQGALTISTPETKKLVHKMRAENMAIMVGTNTVLMDNPRLLNTHWEGRNPIRVTVDRHNRIPADARIWEPTPNPSLKGRASDYPGIDPVIVYREKTDWQYILDDLAKRGIHSILVEGGTTLLNHILETGIWDEIHVEVAPELTIGEGVKAPEVNLPEQYEIIDGHKLYTMMK